MPATDYRWIRGTVTESTLPDSGSTFYRYWRTYLHNTIWDTAPGVFLTVIGGKKEGVLYKPATKTINITINTSNGLSKVRSLTIQTLNYGVTGGPNPTPIDPDEPWGGLMLINGEEIYIELLNYYSWDSYLDIGNDATYKYIGSPLKAINCSRIIDSFNSTTGKMVWALDVDLADPEEPGWTCRMDSKNAFVETFANLNFNEGTPSLPGSDPARGCSYEPQPVNGDDKWDNRVRFNLNTQLYMQVYPGGPAFENENISIRPSDCYVCSRTNPPQLGYSASPFDPPDNTKGRMYLSYTLGDSFVRTVCRTFPPATPNCLVETISQGGVLERTVGTGTPVDYPFTARFQIAGYGTPAPSLFGNVEIIANISQTLFPGATPIQIYSGPVSSLIAINSIYNTSYSNSQIFIPSGAESLTFRWTLTSLPTQSYPGNVFGTSGLLFEWGFGPLNPIPIPFETEAFDDKPSTITSTIQNETVEDSPTIVPTTEETVALNVQPDPVNFPDTDVGSNNTDSITVKNFSTNPVIITGIENSDKYPPLIQAFSSDAAFPITINPGATQTIPLKFSPKSAITYIDALLLKVQGEDFGYPFLATGIGLTAPIRDITLEGNSFDDPNLSYPDTLVNGEKELTLKIKNNGATPGDDDIQLFSIELFQVENNFTIMSGGIPGGGVNLPAGETRNVVIRFKPLSVGEKSITLRLLSNANTGDVDESGYSYSQLTGKGVTGPEPTQKIEFETNFGKYTYSDPQTDTGKIDFGSEVDVKLQVYQKQNFILRNIGTGKITISGLKFLYAPFQNPVAFIMDFEQWDIDIINPFQSTMTPYYFKDGAIDLEPGEELPLTGLWFKPVIVETFLGLVEPILAQGFELDEESVIGLPFTGRGKFIPEDDNGNGGGPPRPEPAPEESGCKNRICAIPYLYEYNLNEPRET